MTLMIDLLSYHVKNEGGINDVQLNKRFFVAMWTMGYSTGWAKEYRRKSNKKMLNACVSCSPGQQEKLSDVVALSTHAIMMHLPLTFETQRYDTSTPYAKCREEFKSRSEQLFQDRNVLMISA